MKSNSRRKEGINGVFIHGTFEICVQGKRSTCDHIHEAVRYIEHLANKIRGLNVKKDELKRLSLRSDNADTTSINTPLKVLTQIDSTMKVNMNQWLAGLEIDIDTDSRQGVSLSRVLGFLTHEGHAVVSCTSIRVNERLLLSIKSEVKCLETGCLGLFEESTPIFSFDNDLWVVAGY